MIISIICEEVGQKKKEIKFHRNLGYRFSTDSVCLFLTQFRLQFYIQYSKHEKKGLKQNFRYVFFFFLSFSSMANKGMTIRFYKKHMSRILFRVSSFRLPIYDSQLNNFNVFFLSFFFLFFIFLVQVNAVNKRVFTQVNCRFAPN